MAVPSVPNTLSNGVTSDATAVNQNFTALINSLTDGTKDLTVNAITTTGAATIGGAVTVTGAATFNGNVTLGNAAGDTLTFTGTPTEDSANAVIDAYSRSTGTTVTARGVAISDVCSNWFNTTTTEDDVTNLTVTITTSGRPVIIMMIATETGGSIRVYESSSTRAQGTLRFYRDSTEVSQFNVASEGASGDVEISIPPSSAQFVDAVAAGTYTYKVTGAAASGDGVQVTYSKLVAYEL